MEASAEWGNSLFKLTEIIVGGYLLKGSFRKIFSKGKTRRYELSDKQGDSYHIAADGFVKSRTQDRRVKNHIIVFKYGGKRNGSKNQIKKNGTEEGSFL